MNVSSTQQGEGVELGQQQYIYISGRVEPSPCNLYQALSHSESQKLKKRKEGQAQEVPPGTKFRCAAYSVSIPFLCTGLLGLGVALESTTIEVRQGKTLANNPLCFTLCAQLR